MGVKLLRIVANEKEGCVLVNEPVLSSLSNDIMAGTMTSVTYCSLHTYLVIASKEVPLGIESHILLTSICLHMHLSPGQFFSSYRPGMGGGTERERDRGYRSFSVLVS